MPETDHPANATGRKAQELQRPKLARKSIAKATQQDIHEHQPVQLPATSGPDDSNILSCDSGRSDHSVSDEVSHVSLIELIRCPVAPTEYLHSQTESVKPTNQLEAVEGMTGTLYEKGSSTESAPQTTTKMNDGSNNDFAITPKTQPLKVESTERILSNNKGESPPSVMSKKNTDEVQTMLQKRPNPSATPSESSAPKHRLISKKMLSALSNTIVDKANDYPSPQLPTEEIPICEDAGVSVVIRGSITHLVLEKLGRLHPESLQDEESVLASVKKVESKKDEGCTKSQRESPLGDSLESRTSAKEDISQDETKHNPKEDVHAQHVVPDSNATRSTTTTMNVPQQDLPVEKANNKTCMRRCFRSCVVPQRCPYTRRKNYRVYITGGPYKDRTGYIVDQRDGLWSTIQSDDPTRSDTFVVSNIHLGMVASLSAPTQNARRFQRDSQEKHSKDDKNGVEVDDESEKDKELFLSLLAKNLAAQKK